MCGGGGLVVTMPGRANVFYFNTKLPAVHEIVPKMKNYPDKNANIAS